MTVVDNARYEPEQILLSEELSPVAERALRRQGVGPPAAGPHPRQDEGRPEPVRLARRERDWRRHSRQAPAVNAPTCRRKRAATRRMVQVPGARGPLHLRTGQGWRRGDRRLHFGQAVRRDVRGRPYPRALTFLGEGALLSLIRRPKVGFLSRDVETTSRSRSAACCRTSCSTSRRRCGSFRGRGCTATSRTSWWSGSRRPATTAPGSPGKPTYDSIDVGQYLQDQRRPAAACSCCTSARPPSGERHAGRGR